MGLKDRLGRLAAAAPAPVFVLAGRGTARLAPALDRLALDPRLRFVDSPRQANVLLLAGGAASRLLRPALRVHDQMSRPRGTVWWLPGEERSPAALRLARTLGLAAGDLVDPDRPDHADPAGGAEAVARAIVRRHRELVTGVRATEPAVLPDEEPAPWRGVGPFGQGGEGMMGGVPYGRPMAMRGPDLSDGLELDRLPVRLGPFYPPLPSGLVLDLDLQGDVIQAVTVGANPFDRPAWRGDGDRHGRDGDPFAAALTRPVPLAVLERARARHHLRWLARVLALLGLDALGRRVLGLSLACAPVTARVADAAEGNPADDLEPPRRAVEDLARRLRSRISPITPPWGLAGATRGVGRIARSRLAGLGPAARAAGLPDDARSDDPAYRALGFEPIVQRSEDAEGGDAWTRLLQRLDEAVQALDLALRAARAGDPTVGGPGVVGSAGRAIEGPRGRLIPGGDPPSARLLALVAELLEGLEWGDAVVALASLDLDLEEAGRGPLPGRTAGEREPRRPTRADRTHRSHRTRRKGEVA